MKRVLICLIIILSLSLTSCKKDLKEDYKYYDYCNIETIVNLKDYKVYKVVSGINNEIIISYYKYDKKSKNFEKIYIYD